jgi:hypothetical protein
MISANGPRDVALGVFDEAAWLTLIAWQDTVWGCRADPFAP